MVPDLVSWQGELIRLRDGKLVFLSGADVGPAPIWHPAKRHPVDGIYRATAPLWTERGSAKRLQVGAWSAVSQRSSRFSGITCQAFQLLPRASTPMLFLAIAR
jgi:hypothetical protein